MFSVTFIFNSFVCFVSKTESEGVERESVIITLQKQQFKQKLDIFILWELTTNFKMP